MGKTLPPEIDLLFEKIWRLKLSQASGEGYKGLDNDVISLAETLLSKYPQMDDAGFFYCYGDSLLKSDRLDKAIEMLEKASSFGAENDDSAVRTIHYRAKMFAYGRAEKREECYRNALKFMEASIKDNSPPSEDQYSLISGAWRALPQKKDIVRQLDQAGELIVDQRKYQQGIPILDSIISQLPRIPNVLCSAAMLYVMAHLLRNDANKMDFIDKAEPLLHQALAIDPNYSSAKKELEKCSKFRTETPSKGKGGCLSIILIVLIPFCYFLVSKMIN